MSIVVENQTTQILPDEQAVLFPTFGYRRRDGDWEVQIRGQLFGAVAAGLKRRMFLGLLRRLMRADIGELTGDIFQRRLEGFLAESRSRRGVTIQLGDQGYRLKRLTRRTGHFTGRIQLPSATAAALRETGDVTDGWLSYRLVLPPPDERSFSGAAQLIEPVGVSVISDIDDTIKISHVSDSQALLRNTFLKEFEGVPGMANKYQQWQERGAAFHYVSSSPWQLYASLADLSTREGLPRGSFHLRTYRFRGPVPMPPILSNKLRKGWIVKSILRRFPHRRFYLVGDSGERDPELYASVARRWPKQVAGVFIRRVAIPDRPAPARRLDPLFRSVAAPWRLFDNAEELPDVLDTDTKRIYHAATRP